MAAVSLGETAAFFVYQAAISKRRQDDEICYRDAARASPNAFTNAVSDSSE